LAGYVTLLPQESLLLSVSARKLDCARKLEATAAGSLPVVLWLEQ
jgi:hypothetical protein